MNANEIARSSYRTPRCEEEAWLAGMILADGHLWRDPRPGKNCANLELVQNERARPVFERLSDIFGRPVWTGRTNAAVRMSFLDLPLVWKRIPQRFQRNSDLERHYWRGVIDGDGCIYTEAFGRYSYDRIMLTYATYEPLVGRAFHDFLGRLGLSATEHPSYEGRRCRRIVVRTDAKALARYLYEDSSIALPWKAERAMA